MNRLVKQEHLGSFTKIEMPTCENCFARKITRKPFGKAKRVELPLQLFVLIFIDKSINSLYE